MEDCTVSLLREHGFGTDYFQGLLANTNTTEDIWEGGSFGRLGKASECRVKRGVLRCLR